MIKGITGLHEAELFTEEFPLATDRSMETVLTVTAFDEWADENNLYSTDCEQATLLDRRNKLKRKINLTASSPAWLAKQGRVPFFIAVNRHGHSYKVQRVEDAFSSKALTLPAQVKSYAGTKRTMIQALLESIDKLSLPPAWQMRISAFDREIERYLRGIDYQTMELDREYMAIRQQLQHMVDTKMIKNGDLLKLMDGDKGEEEDEGS